MENTTVEIWKDIKGYEEKYQVSNLGRVKSKERILSEGKRGQRLQKERILVNCYNNSRYFQVLIYNNEKKPRVVRVHRLVAEAFLEKAHTTATVDHIDNDKTNNNASNLQWMTFDENIKKAVQDKLHAFGERNSAAKLTEKDVKHIRDEYFKTDDRIRGNKEKTLRAIMRGYQISRYGAKAVIYKWSWKHLDR